MSALAHLADILNRKRVGGKVAPEEEQMIVMIMTPDEPNRGDQQSDLVIENDEKSGESHDFSDESDDGLLSIPDEDEEV